jgi:NADH-quinone oxidoreductase subunit N
MTLNDLALFAPVIAAILVAAAVLVVDFIAPGRFVPAIVVTFMGLTLVGAITAITGQAATDAGGSLTAFGGAYVVDALTTYLDLLFIAIVALTMAFAPDYLAGRKLPVAEFAAVLLFAMSGAMLIAGSADLLVLFLGLELMVLPGYMLAGYHKTDGYSTEGAIKYFLLGSFSSAIFLFGLAFVWGLTGTTSIAGVSQILGEIAGGAPLAPGLGLGLAFLMTGVAFKMAAVPFHYWTPDAYQGSPTPVTGYLSVGPKVGAFALIIRLFGDALGPLAADWNVIIIILAALTLTLGNLVALTQDNV